MLLGAGAGQAIEDGYILGRAVQDYLCSSQSQGKDILNQWAQAYQSVRLPRAQKAQKTARQAGQVYEMQTEDMLGKSFDECIPRMRDHLKDRMQWIWTEDIDIAYETVAEELRAK
jgi:salicylate hydroxylase